MNPYRALTLSCLALLGAACASTPEPSPTMLAQAPAKCKIAPLDPAVKKKEPSELEQRYAQMQLHSTPYYRAQQQKGGMNTLEDIDRDCR